jgi:Protein of unknown function (DUF4232)
VSHRRGSFDRMRIWLKLAAVIAVLIALVVTPAASSMIGKPRTPCSAAQIGVTLGAVSGGLGHEGLAVRFTNRGTPCLISGYPGADGLSATGRRVLSAARTPTGYLGGVRSKAIPTVSLGTGQTASALLEWISGPVTGLSCSMVRYFEITPPGAYRSVRLAVASRSFSICKAEIHPVVPGQHAGGGA